MSILFPDMIFDSVDEINFKKLHKMGIRGIIFDIDNTLVPYTQLGASKKVIKIIESAKMAGLQVAFASNNSHDRVEKFNQELGLLAIPRANKPLKRALLAIAEKMDLPCDKIAVIGDQVFTDVYGANRCGMTSILVSPIEPIENLFFKSKRKLEKFVLKRMKNRKEIEK